MVAPVLSRLGQVKGTGDTQALFKQQAIPEIIGAFMTECKFKGTIRERTIRGAKEACFPITGRMQARYHEPGTLITGSTNSPSDLNELIIRLDGLIISDHSQYNLDELMSAWDYRSTFTTEIGRALATEYDQRVARILVATAKKTTSPLGKPLNADRVGFTTTLSAAYNNSATSSNAKGNELIAAISKAVVAMKQKSVPITNMRVVVGPQEADYLLDSDRGVNSDWNGGGGSNGSFGEGVIRKVKGVPIYESLHVTQAPYTLTPYDKNPDYAEDLSKCVAIIYDREAMGVLTLQGIGLDMTSPTGDYATFTQSQLMVGKMAVGMGSLRYESAAAIFRP